MPSLGQKQKKSKEVFCISCAHNFDQEENKACNKNEHRVNKVAKAKTVMWRNDQKTDKNHQIQKGPVI